LRYVDIKLVDDFDELPELIINLRFSHSSWIWYEVGVVEILSCRVLLFLHDFFYIVILL
jgi:hypothetical protein